MTPTLELSGIGVHYGNVPALKDVSLAITPGQVIGLIGPNGAGKSTLLKVCAGLIAPTTGTIDLAGRPLGQWNAGRRARLIGYLPQSRIVAWPVNVARMVALGRLPHLPPWQSLTDIESAEVTQALTQTDIVALADRAVTTLSGGELARALIARLLAGAPEVILADEPIAGLDPAHTLQVMSLFRDLARGGRTVVIVLHDLGMAARFCERVVLLDRGARVADGPPAAVLTPEILERHYHIKAEIVRHRGEMIVVPWSL